ncbi:hypothetical protein EW026_g4846 [Hermanssonia centrifuga]|uniref:Amino acid transporter n=1 Tax=Hermanssonia centrifuga TaxID=98765 RepID=A0A4S4KGV9_9APHY|nr:hypothetical protein EW026_g4846 [Hermanssonia centrifuga]
MNSDEANLARLGYKQEFKRAFTPLEVFGIGFSIIGIFPSIAEEATNASVAVPWAIVGACSIAGILGWAINVAIAFCMGNDVDSIMASPIGQPMATLTACSRQIFAFSRDGGLPFSRYLRRINPHTQTPVNSVWFAAFVSLLLGLLAFAGPAAIGAIFSLVVTGQYTAYSIPITCRFFGGAEWTPGPFNLGRMGFPVAMVALVWMAFSVVILIFPTTVGPTADDMNYTVAVMGGWLILCILYYYFPRYGGVYWFKGPVSTVEILDSDSVSVDLEKEKFEES